MASELLFNLTIVYTKFPNVYCSDIFLTPIFFIFFIPWIIYAFGMKMIELWTYKLGGHPGKKLTEVDHLYIHPDGRVIVPLNDLLPFIFNIEGEMRIETHTHEQRWCSVSILKGRKCYFSLKTFYGMDPGREEIYQFLRRFDLKESERRTSASSDGGGGP